jgi:hypothetical protein
MAAFVVGSVSYVVRNTYSVQLDSPFFGSQNRLPRGRARQGRARMPPRQRSELQPITSGLF